MIEGATNLKMVREVVLHYKNESGEIPTNQLRSLILSKFIFENLVKDSTEYVSITFFYLIINSFTFVLSF